MQFIHTADLHLDSPLHGLRARAGARASELAGATRRAFQALIDHAIRERVEFVVIAGDIYDGNWRDYTTGLVFLDGMARLHKAGIRVALIRGNHDAESQITRRLTLPPNVHEFPTGKADTWLLEDLNVAIHGRSFATRDVRDNLVGSYPEPRAGFFNIGLLHTAATGRPPHDSYAPCELADLVARQYDYWALGHVHTREVLCQKPWVVFPGNLQGRHANECGAKGFSLVTLDGPSVRSVEHVPVDVLRWVVVHADVTGCSTFEDACVRIQRAIDGEIPACDGRTLAVRIVVSGETPAHRDLAGDLERLSAECAARSLQSQGDVWIERIEVKTRAAVTATSSSADGVAELLRTIAAVRADPVERDDIRRLLDGGLAKIAPSVRSLAGLEALEGELLDTVLARAETLLLHRLAPSGANP